MPNAPLKIGDHVKVIHENDALYWEVGVIVGTRDDGKLKVKVVDGPVVWYDPDHIEKIL